MDRKQFFIDVYETTKLIPEGRVTTYGAIAKYLGRKGYARVVGWAMHGAVQEAHVPAHRVVNSQGLLSGRHHFESPSQMQELLEAEGLTVVDNRIKQFSKYFWDPSTELL
jgi:methylated-DNA-protein-cysteine methyltransferase-like protein